MKNVIYYENHKGKMLSLSGEGIIADIQELFNWKLKEQSTNNRIVSFSRKITSRDISVAVYNTPRAMQLRDELYDVAAVDTVAGKCGKLWFNDWYLNCYISESSIKYCWTSNGMATFKLAVIAENPVWRKDTFKSITERHDQTTDGLDYPCDFAFDYGLSASEISMNNNNAYPSDVFIRIYGATDLPSVTIGGNVYSVDVDIKNGERLEIDTEAKTVVLVDIAGNKKSVLDKIKGEYRNGSGSYIFEQLKSGENKIEWSGMFDFDVIMHEVRDVVRFSDTANLYA